MTLAVLALILATIVFCWRIEWGLAAVIFLLPFERLTFSVGGTAIRWVQLAALALVLSYLVGLVRQKLHHHKLTGFWILALLLIPTFIATMQINYSQIWRNYLILLFLIGLVLVVAQLTTSDRLSLIKGSFFASAAVVCLFGLFQYLGSLAHLPPSLTGLKSGYTAAAGFGFPRVQGPATEPLFFANYLLIPYFISLALWIRRPSRWLLGLWGLVTINLLLTTSRGGILAAGIGSCLLVFLQRDQIAKLKGHLANLATGLTLIVVLGAGLTVLASYATVRDPWVAPRGLIGFFSPSQTQSASFNERSSTIELAKKMFAASPWWGVGPAGFGPKLLNYPNPRPAAWPVANNASWELLAELGVIGFGMLIYFLSRLVITAWQRASTAPLEARPWLVGLSVAIIALWIQYQTFSGFFLTYFWVVYGLLLGLMSRGKPREA